ncbi:hypothetical protein AAVH_24051 [Aphelenchoides avenae]|nr:hypothetical protein AAVH_24051 [Aphelenchus avenae]
MSSAFANTTFPSYQEAASKGFANYGFDTGRTETFANRGFSGLDCGRDFPNFGFSDAVEDQDREESQRDDTGGEEEQQNDEEEE